MTRRGKTPWVTRWSTLAFQTFDVQDQQPDGARKWIPDASSLWWGLELKRSAYTAESDEKAMDLQLI